MKVCISDSKKVNAQKDGVWATLGESSFLISHIGSLKFQRILNRLQAPHRKEIAKGTLDPGISKKILAQAMAKGLVHDWKDVVDSEGKDVPFSEEVCEQCLYNNDDVREFIQEFSTDIANFKAEELEEERKS